jgi:hypothetical protein
MKKIIEMSRTELAAYVSTHLKKHDIEVTLTGGSCVSIYSKDKYVSGDLDFIETFRARRKLLINCLKEIGFSEENRSFIHPDTDLFIEFPPGPLAVGDEPITDIITIQTEVGDLRIISPTESVKDRLAAYYFWNDLQCLEQALLVAQYKDIDIDEVKRWSLKEGEAEKFQIFKNRLLKI